MQAVMNEFRRIIDFLDTMIREPKTMISYGSPSLPQFKKIASLLDDAAEYCTSCHSLQDTLAGCCKIGVPESDILASLKMLRKRAEDTLSSFSTQNEESISVVISDFELFLQMFIAMVSCEYSRRLEYSKVMNKVKKSHKEASCPQVFYNSILANIGELVVVVDKSGIIYKNAAATAAARETKGRSTSKNVISFILSCYLDESFRNAEYYDTYQKKWYSIEYKPLNWHDESDTRMYVATDITITRRNEDKLRRAAEFDVLTKVGNRSYGMRLFNEALQEKRNFPISICFIDLDGLKPVNDNYGHTAGDAYLQFMAATMQKHLPSGGVLSRMGGDEFFMVMEKTTMGAAERVIQAIKLELASHYSSKTLYTYDFSYGLLEIDSDNKESAYELLQRSDILMYKQKQSKKGKR